MPKVAERPESRQLLLLDAAQRYMRGELSLEEYQEFKQQHALRYGDAMRAIGRSQESTLTVTPTPRRMFCKS